MRLEVAKIHDLDVYKDMARVPEDYRIDAEGQLIPEGDICKVSVRGRSAFLSVRGDNTHCNAAISLDERTREALGLELREEADFIFQRLGFVGLCRWAWGAADPAYRIASRVALLSIILTAIGTGLGLISLYISLRSTR